MSDDLAVGRGLQRLVGGQFGVVAVQPLTGEYRMHQDSGLASDAPTPYRVDK